MEALARVGLVAKGAVYGLVGLLALELALGHGGAATSNQGAMQQLAASGYGRVLVVLLAIGLGAYAVWRLVQAWRGDELPERVVAGARFVVYSVFTYTAVEILAGSRRQESQNGKAHKATAVVLSWPGGTVLVGIVGAVFIAIGCWQLYEGMSGKFEERWRGQSNAGRVVGVVGHVARFVVFTLIGIFAIRAAADYNPKQSVGLDGALQKVAHAGYGSYLLGLTAAGLIAYGVFCLFDARYRDVTQGD